MHLRQSARVVAWLRTLLPRPKSRPAAATARPRLETLEGRDLPAAGPREQYALELVNRLRTNPAAELGYLLNSNDADVNAALRFFNVDRNVLQQQWNRLTPTAPLAWNDSLAAAALAHSQLMLQTGQQSHQLPGEADLLTRIQATGYSARAVAENVFAFADSLFHQHAAFAIDWGSGPGGIQSPAGHRDNLLDPTYREVGFGIVDAPAGSAVGPLLITHDFGARLSGSSPFLLGVVFRDGNSNGFYDIGEGLSGVTVSAGGATTTTAPGGGYQLSVAPGAYTVTFSGGALGGTLTRGATVGTTNAKVDLVTSATAPLQFTASSFEAVESSGSAAITLTRGGDLGSTVSVRVATGDGSGRAGTDYDAVATTVTFGPNETQKTVNVVLRNNALVDGDRTVALTLSAATGGGVLGTPSQALLTILDDEGPGRLGFGSASFRGGEGGSATLTVTRAGNARGAVTVAYATADGTAESGADYTAFSGTLTFADGQTSRTIVVAVTDDATPERAETVTLTLSNPSAGAVLSSRPSTEFRIVDNDVPAVPDGPLPPPLADLARQIARSREHYDDFVTKAYRRYLGRAADGGGLNFWASRMQAGTTQEQMETSFLGSAEYIANHGGTGREWVRGMYRDLLGREPSTAEVDYWSGLLARGATTFQVAFGFAASAERAGQRVGDTYRTLLGRTPSTAEVALWVNAFLRGQTNEDMVAGFVSSPEYYSNAQKGQNNASSWAVSAYRDVLFRDANRSEVEASVRRLGF